MRTRPGLKFWSIYAFLLSVLQGCQLSDQGESAFAHSLPDSTGRTLAHFASNEM